MRTTVAQRSGTMREQRDHQVDEHQHDHAETGGDEEAGELRRHANGAGLVDDEHAEEHAEGADDGLADQRTGADTGDHEVGDHERERADEQALKRGVAQHDRRVVLLAPEHRDQHQHEAADMPHHEANGIASAKFCATKKYDTTATAVSTASVIPGLGDDVVDGQRPRDPRLPLVGVLRHVGLGMYRLRTVAGGSGTELRISALPLGQGTKYRVAGLPHRRFLS